jgi:hypothetical protein
MPGFDHGVLSIAPAAGFESARERREQGETAQSALPSSATLSARLWGLDLNKGLPRTLTSDGVQAAPGELTRVRDFLATEFPALREEDLGGSPSARMLDAKRWYLQNACDVIELRHDDRTVGVLIGAPEDWSSYYVRIFAVLQAYQRPALRRRFIRECLFEPLIAHQVERVMADTSPMNLGMSVVFNELRFHVTGHQLSDRWGPLVRYTKFLDPACEAAFIRRFAGISGGPTTTRKESPP